MPGLTGTAPSRWGVRGKEDLGGGLNAEFALESGFGVDPEPSIRVVVASGVKPGSA
jgi:hypothetical protein